MDNNSFHGVKGDDAFSQSQHNFVDYAEVAWRYYQPGVGVNQNTGLHYANKDWHRFTDWDLGSYILAIIDAEKLGILPKEGDWGADYRIDKIMDFLQTRQLSEDDLPYLVYDAETGGLPPEVGTPRETNVYDTGRLLISLHHLKEHRPELATTIEWIISTRCDYTKLVDDFPTVPSPEMYYVATGFTYFGFNNSRIRTALDSPQRMMEGEQIEIYGVDLPNVKLISEQILHAMLEIEPNPTFREISQRIYLAQEKRWETTGKYTAFTEGAIEVSPYYIYEYIVLPPNTWIIMAIGFGELDLTPIVYIKAGIGFHALYQTDYTESLIQNYINQLETDQGFYEGVDETGNVIQVLTDKTNSMIISAARYFQESAVLSMFPSPFIASGTVNNTLIVVGESKPHGPCDASHSIDTLGGMLITSRLGLEAGSGQLKSAVDGWLISYNQTTGETEILDKLSNLIAIGSPGVNLVAYHYNRTKSPEGHVRPEVLFFRNLTMGQNYLQIRTSGKRYYMEYEGGRLTADYATIQMFRDDSGRHVMLVYGLGAEGTRIASEAIKNYEQHDLQGRAIVMKYYDSDDDGRLDALEIVEVIS